MARTITKPVGTDEAAWKPQRPWPLDLVVNAFVLLGLFAAYSFVRRFTADAWTDAIVNSGEVLNFQAWLGLPHEGTMQLFLLDRPRVVRAMNLYYMWAHFPVTGAFVVWAWARHRNLFPMIRRTLITVTGAGLILHLVYPLAPPRMLPGFVDTGALFGPSPYDIDASAAANQIAAMPSLHVGWALIVALSVVWLAPGRARLLALVHPLITLAVVVLTANHYWMDGIVAIVLVIGAWAYSVKRERLDAAARSEAVRSEAARSDARAAEITASEGNAASEEAEGVVVEPTGGPRPTDVESLDLRSEPEAIDDTEIPELTLGRR